MKKFSFPKIKMQFEPIFLSGSLAVLSSGFLFGIFGQTIAAAGGEMRPNYFHYPPHDRKSQIRLARFGGLGNQIVRDFERKNQLAILHLRKENF